MGWVRFQNQQTLGNRGWGAPNCSVDHINQYGWVLGVYLSIDRVILWFFKFWCSIEVRIGGGNRKIAIFSPNLLIWRSPPWLRPVTESSATTKNPQKIFFQSIIQNPKPPQRWSSNSLWARRTVQIRTLDELWLISSRIGKNQRTLVWANCRTTRYPIVERLGKNDTELMDY